MRFELNSDNVRPGKGSSNGRSQVSDISDEASALVRLYHRHRFGREEYQPASHEIRRATTLLRSYDAERVRKLVPQVARTVEQKFGDDRFFGAAITYFENALSESMLQESERKRQEERDTVQSIEDEAMTELKQRRDRRRAHLLAKWREQTPANQ
ncbi:MAG: hypothetical protein GTO41_01945, partial [Burkholderiales bacterium]|nr:hypothetical protein [Burkholderiales bacterium]